MATSIVSRRSSRANLLSVGQLCKTYGCHPNSVRRWIDSGELEGVKLPSGHRRVPISSARMFFEGVEEYKQTENVPVALLARVSSNKQGKGFNCETGESKHASDLERQVLRLQKYAKQKYNTDGTLYADVGSGLSFSRKNFLKLIDDVLAGKYRGGVILVTYPERMARWGRELIEKVCGAFDCRIEAIEEDEDRSDTQELVSDMIALTTIFSARIHGRRAAKTLTVELEPETVKEMVCLRKQRHPVSYITEVLEERGHRDTKGRTISRYVIDKYLDNNGAEMVLEATVGNGQERNSFEQWHDKHVVRVREEIDRRTGKISKDSRLPKAVLYEAYEEWCKQNKKGKPVSARQAGIILQKKYGYRTKLNCTGRVVYCGIGLA